MNENKEEQNIKISINTQRYMRSNWWTIVDIYTKIEREIATTSISDINP